LVHEVVVEHALGFDVQHALRPQVPPPQAMFAPMQVGGASASQTPGDVAVAPLQWKPDWQPIGELSALQHNCSLLCAHVGVPVQAVLSVVQHVPAPHETPPHWS
jgi:hypothetical protein